MRDKLEFNFLGLVRAVVATVGYPLRLWLWDPIQGGVEKGAKETGLGAKSCIIG